MKRKEFKISIAAPRNVVWFVLWNNATYRQWTSVFSEGSHTVSDWKEGSEIIFLDPKGSGMYSIISKKEEPALMTFSHQGDILEGVKQEASTWKGAIESYSLVEKGKEVELTVTIDLTDDFVDYFTEVLPKALQKIKELAESDSVKKVTIQATVKAPVEKVWKFWSEPQHLMKWNSASPDWHTPRAENDLRAGGKFLSRMEARDGSFGFDFRGIYDKVKPNELISYTMDDGRKVNINFSTSGDETKVIETFEAESENSIQMQHDGWQSILNNFKKYTESN